MSNNERLHRFVYAYTALAITGAVFNLRNVVIYVCAGAVLCVVCVCVCVCVCWSCVVMYVCVQELCCDVSVCTGAVL